MLSVILGCGYSGIRIARQLVERGADERAVIGTRRDENGLSELAASNLAGRIVNGSLSEAFRAELSRTTHLISSVAPARTPPLDDPMLTLLQPLIKAGEMPALEWIGYLSTIGVYGDHEGEWVDENTACVSLQPRSIVRMQAEEAWRVLGEQAGVPVATLRLSGIYGPDRNAVRDALVGRARMLIKPGQVFNRIHVDDLATAAVLCAENRYNGVLNITDDEPATPQSVIAHAHDLVGLAHPAAVPFADADISDMARSFYAENKRVSNARSKSVLGLQYRYPGYQAGLASLVEHERASAAR